MEIKKNIPLSIRRVLERSRSKTKRQRRVYAQVIYKRKKAVISMDMSVDESEWDFSTGLLKTNKTFNVRQNNVLLEAEERIIEIFTDLNKSGIVVTVKALKQGFLGNPTEISTTKFMDYYAKYLADMRLRPNEYGEAVIGHYVKTQTHLTRFLKIHSWEKIKLNELSCRFLEMFEHYLLTTPNKQTGRPMNANTMTTYIRKIKAVVNSAWRKQIIHTNPFATYKLKSLKQVNKVFLTKEERQKLRTHNLGNNLALQRVRDCFLFCCETGLRHSDATQLTEKMVSVDSEGMYWLTLRQVKTKEALDIPMSLAAVQIYEGFESHRRSTGFVLPMLTNQKVNTHLKVIAELVGITKRLTFHVSRHTFATSALEDGMDIAAVSSLMGHGAIKTTQIYAKMTRTRKAEVIRQLDKRRAEYLKVEKVELITPSMN